MATDGRSIVIIDTSVLVNFLAVNRVDLLGNHPGFRFQVTDHVRGEVTEDYPEQLARLDQALDAGQLEQVAIAGIDELQVFATLSEDGSLGVGECAAIAAAFVRGVIVAIDDKPARNRAVALSATLQMTSTADIMVSLIRASVLDIPTADAIKSDWELTYRFRLKFASFSEVV